MFSILMWWGWHFTNTTYKWKEYSVSKTRPYKNWLYKNILIFLKLILSVYSIPEIMRKISEWKIRWCKKLWTAVGFVQNKCIPHYTPKMENDKSARGGCDLNAKCTVRIPNNEKVNYFCYYPNFVVYFPNQWLLDKVQAS